MFPNSIVSMLVPLILFRVATYAFSIFTDHQNTATTDNTSATDNTTTAPALIIAPVPTAPLLIISNENSNNFVPNVEAEMKDKQEIEIDWQNTDPLKWEPAQVSAWMKSCGNKFGKHAFEFEDKQIDGAQLLQMSAEDLKETATGAKKIICKLLLMKIKELKKVSETKQELNPNRAPMICGLSNLGNTCFMNSSIQILLQTPHLVQFLREYQISQQQINSKNMLNSLSTLARKVSVSTSTLSPTNVYGSLTNYNELLGDGDQHDATDSFSSILEVLDENINSHQVKYQDAPYSLRIRKDKEFGSDAEEKQFADALFLQYNLNNSKVRECMNGVMRQTNTCLECKQQSVIYETFRMLDVSVFRPNNANRNSSSKSKTFSTISECLDEHFRRKECKLPQECPNENCGSRSKLFECEKQIVLSPLNLIVHLNRSRHGSHKSKALISYSADEQLSLASMNDTYSLYGVACHGGTMNYGHYIAKVKSLQNGKWYHASDSRVEHVPDLKQIVSANANLLLFTKVLK